MIFSMLLAENDETRYFTPENIHHFADYLYKEGDYLRAANEFERYLLSFDSIPAFADSIYYKIGLCYRLARDFLKSINYFNKVIKDFPQSVYLSEVYYQIALCYSLMDKYDESIKFLSSNLSFIEKSKVKLRANQLVALNYILRKEWNHAISFLNNLDIITKDSATLLLANYAKEGQRLPRKSKFLAGLFSSLIPGSGKIYCNRSWDGFFSLLTIGITSWQAYDGFRKDGARSIKGWFFGSISAIFYLGNIYGSVVAAKIYNEQQEEKFLNKVKIFINVNIR